MSSNLERLPPRVWIASILTLAAGLAIAWVDTRPTWDDTGITAVAVVLIAFGGSVAGAPFWLAALCVAGPMLAAELPKGAGVLMAIPFALIGAYVGTLVRRRNAGGQGPSTITR